MSDLPVGVALSTRTDGGRPVQFCAPDLGYAVVLRPVRSAVAAAVHGPCLTIDLRLWEAVRDPGVAGRHVKFTCCIGQVRVLRLVHM
jgi:hypothetical protein